MRRDIQLLRGIAVLFVVVYHAQLGIFKRGYLGVDVFFVLSGYLITKIILEGLDKGSFSFLHFYLRRAKRLLPALYSTLLATTVIAHVILTPEDRKDFAAQLIGSLTFVANMVLPTQIGYFAAQAEDTPLLHIWSLSLEEQYYFTLPLFLFLVPHRWRLIALIVAFACSIAWCLAWVVSSGAPPFLWRIGDASRNEWAFFLFPTRAWELLAGSVCAWVMLNRKDFTIAPAIKWVSLLAIFVTATWGLDSIHPRGDAIIVVMATGLVVLGKDNWLPKSRYASSIERIGDWSYSIYLVHWPLFVTAHVVFLEQVPTSIRGALVVTSIIFGFLQYRYIETRFRYQWQRPTNLVWQEIAIASLALLVAPVGILASISKDSIASDPIKDARKINYGLSEKCAGSFDHGILKAECLTGETPKLAVWGDSYAMHLVPGLSIMNPNLVQLTKSVCGPIVGLAPVYGRYNEMWAKECLLHNQNSLSLIINSKDITHVILSSAFNQYFGASEGGFLVDGKLVERNDDVARYHLIKTIQELRRAGKEPILIAPPPRSGFNIGSCLERQDRNLFYVRDGCNVKYDEYLERESSIIAALSKIKEETNVRLVWLGDLLCKDYWCQTRINGTYIYRDGGHLSIEGSTELLGEWVVENDLPLPKNLAIPRPPGRAFH